MTLERVVQVEQAGIPELHDRGRGEGLRDRADPILRIWICVDAVLHTRDAERLLPNDLAVADGSRADRRDALARLRLANELCQLSDWRLRRAQTSPERSESPRPPPRHPDPRCRDGSPRARSSDERWSTRALH